MIAATNRVDILDPALLRSGRLDRKIEFPSPNEEARARIMQIHSRKMNVQLVHSSGVDLCVIRTTAPVAGASTPYKRWSKCTMEKVGGAFFCRNLGGGSALIIKKASNMTVII